MTVRWSKIKNRCLRILQDTARETQVSWSDDDMRDYANAALTDLSVHTAQKKIWETVLETPSTVVELPGDILELGPVSIQVQGLYWQFLTPVTWKPGETLPTPYTFSLSVNGYYEWPEGTVNFLYLIPAGQKLRFQYFAYWAEIEADDDVIPFRERWLEEALYWNVLSRAVTKTAIQAANLRQYNIKVDSGEPEDNPMLKMSHYFYRKYLEVLADNPSNAKAVWEASN